MSSSSSGRPTTWCAEPANDVLWSTERSTPAERFIPAQRAATVDRSATAHRSLATERTADDPGTTRTNPGGQSAASCHGSAARRLHGDVAIGGRRRRDREGARRNRGEGTDGAVKCPSIRCPPRSDQYFWEYSYIVIPPRLIGIENVPHC